MRIIMTRVPFLSKEDLPINKQNFYDEIFSLRGHVARPFEALLNSPELASKVAMLGEHLRYIGPSIASEIREIVTLTIAKICNCQYVWTHHVESAKEAGLRKEVIEAIRQGGPPRRLLPKESVYIQFTRELLEDKQIRDTTYAAVEHLLGQQVTVDLVIIIGYYTMLCLSINALEVNLEDEIIPDLEQ
jgi:4-carboxymuconolactone decarboxylase